MSYNVDGDTMDFELIKNNIEINTYIEQADKCLAQINYTEHSFNHVNRCVKVSEYILKELGYDDKTIFLAKVAAYMHDIGNVINRENHAQNGALLSNLILSKLGMNYEDIAIIMSAIGNHDESSANVINEVSAALILADKTDVRRTRVRKDYKEFGIHNRVNYAVINSQVTVNKEQKIISLNLTIDTKICSIMDYFEIFLSRMLLCKKASNYFNCEFQLKINNQSLL